MKTLIEYAWSETTQNGDFLYEKPDGTFVLEYRAQPLKVETPSLDKYWSELRHYLETQQV